MRLVHTADWHVGREWRSVSRLEETAAVLDHLARFLTRERVDLLLVAGDLFDAPSPSAEAEALVFGFFRRIGEAGVQTVAIAGNHDSPGRVEAWARLAELVGVQAVGRLRRRDQGGLVTVRTGAETAQVAAMPFAPARTLIRAEELLRQEERSIQLNYAERFSRAAAHLCGGFRADAVNLLMAHVQLQGALLGSSERQAHLGDAWTALPETLPASAQYVALGHIHRHQRMDLAAMPTYYSGAPLQLDFGEVGQGKVFLFVEAAAGKPPRVEPIPFEGGKLLADHRLTWEAIQQKHEELAQAGWLRLTVPVEAPHPDLAREIKRLLPNCVAVRLELPPAGTVARRALPAQATPLELYRHYHAIKHQAPPAACVEEGFLSLLSHARGDLHASGAS